MCTVVGSNPSLPVYSGELQGKGLGMAVQVFSPDGKDIESTGEPGELVCTRPHPSMPIAFWGDKNGEKYEKAYFDTYPGISATITVLVLLVMLTFSTRNMEARRFYRCQSQDKRIDDTWAKVRLL